MVMCQKQGVAIRRSGLERLGRQLAASAGLVLHDHRHAQLVLELVGQHAGNDVGAAAGREANQHLDRTGLAPCDT